MALLGLQSELGTILFRQSSIPKITDYVQMTHDKLDEASAMVVADAQDALVRQHNTMLRAVSMVAGIKEEGSS